MSYKIVYYEQENRRSRVEDFLVKLAKKSPKDFAARLCRFEAGNPGSYRSLGNQTFELKINRGPGYRVYFTTKENIIVIVHINSKGPKKSQNLDIQLSKKLVKKFHEENKCQ